MGREARRKREQRLARQSRAQAKLARAAEGQRRGCLICRRHDQPFESEEHPLSESMGNTELVLPNGVVCDTCNGGVLSDLDQTLCEFFPLKMRRTFLGIQSKAGKVPQTRFATGSLIHKGLTHDGQPSLFFNITGAAHKTFYEKGRVGDRVELRFSATGGRKLTPRYCSALSRALLKTALECSWLEHGEMMLEPRFDHVRDAILGEPCDGYFAIERQGDPHHDGCELQCSFGRDATGREMVGVIANYFGIWMATNSPMPDPPFEAPEDRLIIVPFTETDFRAAA